MTAPVPFDGVYKMSGVYASAGTSEDKVWITIREFGNGIQVLTPDFKAPVMTIAEARSLAAQIMELARRHEVRKAQE
jgi:hypothetical protein